MTATLISIALGLAFAYVIAKPLGDGLFDTSMWVAKVMTPPDTLEGEAATHHVRIGQAALMDGWLANVPFYASVSLWLSLVVGFFWHWWFTIVLFVLATFVGAIVKIIWGHTAAHYLRILHHKMANRQADYKRESDFERASAAEEMCRVLEELLVIYQNSPLRPPSPKQLASIPYGNNRYWLEHASGGA